MKKKIKQLEAEVEALRARIIALEARTPNVITIHPTDGTAQPWNPNFPNVWTSRFAKVS